MQASRLIDDVNFQLPEKLCLNVVLFLFWGFIWSKNPKRNQALETLLEHWTHKYSQLTTNPSTVNASSHYHPPHTKCRCRGKGNNILVGTVVKSKVGELEDEVREVFPMRRRKELTGVAKWVSGNRSFLVRFQDVWVKDIISNKLTAVTVDMIPVN